jgi:L-fucose isomerase-like protein
MDARFAVLPVASPAPDVATSLHHEEALSDIIADYAEQLADLGGMIVDRAHVEEAPLMVFVLTGGTERTILDVWEERGGTAEPLLLLTHPGQNSLPAALEALARVRQLGGHGRILYLRGQCDADCFAAIDDAVHDVETHTWLRATRIGIVGDPSDWLVASSPDPKTVQAAWGPHLVDIPLRKLYQGYTGGSDDALALEIIGSSDRSTVEAAAVGEAADVLTALKRVVEEEQLDSVSIRCFDVINDLGTTACLALSQLNDEGLIAGCEGDAVSTVAMLWARELINVTPWMANPARIDEDAGTLLLAHCTVPRGLVETYGLSTHFESKIGVGIAGEVPAGDVTLIRIGGSNMEELWLQEGEIVRGARDDDLCRTQVHVLLGPDPIRQLLTEPLGNHIVLVPGHHAARLRAWWEMFIAA